jgi:hypothetical protein
MLELLAPLIGQPIGFASVGYPRRGFASGTDQRQPGYDGARFQQRRVAAAPSDRLPAAAPVTEASFQACFVQRRNLSMNNVPEERPGPPALLLYSKPAEARVPTAGWCDDASKALALSVAERLGYGAVAVTDEQADLVKAAVPRADVTRRGKVTLSPAKPDVLQRLLANLAGDPRRATEWLGDIAGGGHAELCRIFRRHASSGPAHRPIMGGTRG